MDKEEVVHIYNGILLSHKKELNSAICRHMDRIRDCQTHIVLNHLYVECKINDTDELICKAEIETNLWIPRQKEGRMNWEIGTDIYPLLCIK